MLSRGSTRARARRSWCPGRSSPVRIITPDEYQRDARARALADVVLARAGLDPNEVLELRMDERGIELDVIDRPPRVHAGAVVVHVRKL